MAPRLAEPARTARRADILAGALACFARTGYHATTMADVAAAAGVSKGTPYLYFPSKEALFIALHDEWDCGLGDWISLEVEALTEPERRSPRRVLRAVTRAVGAHVEEHTDTCRVLMEARTLAAYYPEIATAVEAAAERTHQQLQGLFRAGIAAGEWPQDTDTALAARIFTAGIYGLMAHWNLKPRSFSWEAAAASLSGDPGSRPTASHSSSSSLAPSTPPSPAAVTSRPLKPPNASPPSSRHSTDGQT
ncbi:MAG: TetR/AcrR family transcriptional regulator [Acidimicrobiales bacterium]